ncbi:MAG: right-handed parallel beta-helix repeat-containing protein [Pirellulales bacterium]|nr:right-handed parallel beta-helix repeat-containing protein [Pirellulales bacterium]
MSMQEIVLLFSAGYLLNLAWKGAAILVTAMMLAGCMQRRAAAARNAVWALALGSLLVLPFLLLSGPSWKVPGLPWLAWDGAVNVRPATTISFQTHGDSVAQPHGFPANQPAWSTRPRTTSDAVAFPAVPTDSTLGDRAPRIVKELPRNRIASLTEPYSAIAALAPEAGIPSGTGPEQVSWRIAWWGWIVGIWIAGMVFFLSPYMVGLVALARLLRRALPVKDPFLIAIANRSANVIGVRRPVRMLQSRQCATPMVAGIFRPTILLPFEATAWSLPVLRMALLHELAHIRRQDCLIGLAGRLAQAIHWFNPLAMYAFRRLRATSEEACDDLVLNSGQSPTQYADSLLEITRLLRMPRQLSTVAIAMARSTRLEQRFRAILDPNRNRGNVTARGLVVGSIIAACLVVPVAAFQGEAGERVNPAEEMSSAEETTYGVAQNGIAPYQSIQEAIDSAPDGATIRIGPGLYEERLTITKPVSIVGAGWDQTVITAAESAEVLQDRSVMEKIQQEFKAATSDDERQAILTKFREQSGMLPTVTIRNTAGVELRGLQMKLGGRHMEGKSGINAIVEIMGSTVTIADSAAVGSPANGIVVNHGSQFTLSKSLVAGVWATGIQIGGGERGQSKASEARIENCDVRNCHHRCIVIAPGNNATVVENCRISGSAWHGMRYDHSRPTITGNVIFNNERFGIYASGDTAATVKGNLFHANGMAGIGCWFRNRDTIEGNTFTANKRSGLELYREAAPTVRKNIFFSNAQAVSIEQPGSGPARLFTGNYFWKNGSGNRASSQTADLEGPPGVEEILAEGADNVFGDPLFVDADAAEFSLQENSPARQAGAGVLEPLAFTSPWPQQPEENAIIADRQRRERSQVAAISNQQAQEMAQPWIDDIMQVRDESKRRAGVEKLRESLASRDPVVQYAGLQAFVATADANYDKASFRGLLLPLTQTTQGGAQVKAFYAIGVAGLQSGDLEILLDAAANPSPELQNSASHLIMLFTQGTIQGRAAEVVLSLLDTEDQNVRREVLRGLWGARVAPELESRLIEIARTKPESRGDAIYFALSTLQDKSRAVIDELLTSIDTNDQSAGRALWGLGHGVTREGHELVADFMLQLFDARNSPQIRRECLGNLGKYGSSKHIVALEAIIANELISDSIRKEAEFALQQVRGRSTDK